MLHVSDVSVFGFLILILCGVSLSPISTLSICSHRLVSVGVRRPLLFIVTGSDIVPRLM
jgi:hypothetical protein